MTFISYRHSLYWECGLKLRSTNSHRINKRSLPVLGVWIEVSSGIFGNVVMPGHSLYWECGLKSWYDEDDNTLYVSLPVLGVWIEVRCARGQAKTAYGHSLYWECGLKCLPVNNVPTGSAVTPCIGSVD